MKANLKSRIMRKSIIALTFFTFLMFIGCNEKYNNDKSNKPKKGNAYGKNKGDLKGKEFGQERAKQAHLKNEQRKLEKSKSKEKSHKKDNKKNKNSKI
ncbi:hypothetical protein ACFL4B_00415 [Candidatus Neomarinimicrobiota bacterium]